MRIAISQPTYLPWIGYFDLIDQVDVFVLLDTVQFEKQSWQHRNRIKTATGLQWLTVPVFLKGRFGQKISEVEIRERDFWRKHLRGIQLNYSRASCFVECFAPFSSLYLQSPSMLLDLNKRILAWFLEIFSIPTPVILASALPQEGKRTELLANMCKALGADEYLSPIGAADYLLPELHLMSDQGINVMFHHFDHPAYRQLFSPFLPYACALDLLLNEGDKSMNIIRQGRRAPYSSDILAARMTTAQA